MLQSFKNKNLEEYISEIRLPKTIFSCLLLIVAIFAGICCQINQTEQNAYYIKKYLAEKNGYYSSLVTLTHRKISEKYYNSLVKTEDFSSQFRTGFFDKLGESTNVFKEGMAFMQLKYLNEYFTEIITENINLEDYEKQLNYFLDQRFSKQSKISNPKEMILNNFAAKTDRLLSKERISIDPAILEAFISPMVDIYYSQLLLVSHATFNQNPQAQTLRLLAVNLPIVLFLIFLILGYFFYTGVAGRLVIFCVTLTLFFMAFLLQLPTSNHNIDLTYNQYVTIED